MLNAENPMVCLPNYECLSKLWEVRIIGSHGSDPLLVGRSWCLNSNDIRFGFKVEGNFEMKVMSHTVPRMREATGGGGRYLGEKGIKSNKLRPNPHVT